MFSVNTTRDVGGEEAVEEEQPETTEVRTVGQWCKTQHGLSSLLFGLIYQQCTQPTSYVLYICNQRFVFNSIIFKLQITS